MKTVLKILVAAALVIPLVVPAVAQAQQYQPWSNPDAAAEATAQVQDLVKRLNTLIEEAERSRAADPQFLRDLRKLADEYRRSPPVLLMSDDFGDGDFTANPRWTVTTGRYWVEPGWGLRSAIKPGAAPTGSGGAPEQKRMTGKEAVGAIFGQILQQALDPEGRAGGGQAGGSGSTASATAIQTSFELSNTFTVEVDFSS